jgi:hypothetical protein
MSSSSTSTSSMTIITLVKFSSIVVVDAQISIFRCLTKATNSALSSSSSSSEFPISSKQGTHVYHIHSD